MLRVKDPAIALDFYTRILGLRVLRKLDFEEMSFSLYFLAHPQPGELVPDDSGERMAHTFQQRGVLELTHNWDTAQYVLGNAYGHIAIEIDDIYACCEEVRQKGGKVVREPGPMKHGSTVIAFVEDPDGYKIEFTQK